MSRFSNRLADHHQDLPTVRSEVKGELSIDPPEDLASRIAVAVV